MNAAAITDFTAAIDHRDEVLARKRLEERVALLEEFNRLLVESSGDCILIVDSNGCIVSINAAGRELLGLRSEDVVLRRHWAELFPDLEGKTAPGRIRLSHTRSTFQATSRTRSGDTKFWNITFTS